MKPLTLEELRAFGEPCPCYHLGHAMFCGCLCHRESYELSQRIRDGKPRMGTTDHGPFCGWHVWRAPGGLIIGMERADATARGTR